MPEEWSPEKDEGPEKYMKEAREFMKKIEEEESARKQPHGWSPTILVQPLEEGWIVRWVGWEKDRFRARAFQAPSSNGAFSVVRDALPGVRDAMDQIRMPAVPPGAINVGFKELRIVVIDNGLMVQYLDGTAPDKGIQAKEIFDGGSDPGALQMKIITGLSIVARTEPPIIEGGPPGPIMGPRGTF